MQESIDEKNVAREEKKSPTEVGPIAATLLIVLLFVVGGAFFFTQQQKRIEAVRAAAADATAQH